MFFNNNNNNNNVLTPMLCWWSIPSRFHVNRIHASAYWLNHHLCLSKKQEVPQHGHKKMKKCMFPFLATQLSSFCIPFRALLIPGHPWSKVVPLLLLLCCVILELFRCGAGTIQPVQGKLRENWDILGSDLTIYYAIYPCK